MKPKIAMVTPLPPHPSGIADYSAELLPELSALVCVDVYYIGHAPNPLSSLDITIKPFSLLKESVNEYDSVILQVANAPEYKQVIEFAEAFSSIVVLHDLNISGVYGHAYLNDQKLRRFFSEILYQEGVVAYTKSLFKFAVSRKCPSPDEYCMNTKVAKSAKWIIVHSAAAAASLGKQHGSLPISVVSHGTQPVPSVDESIKSKARADLSLPQEAFIVGAFGTLDKRKRIHVLLDAMKEMVSGGNDIYCCLVGASSYEWDQLVTNSNLTNNVHLTGRVPLETFYKYMAALDLCVNLRYPWMGEESGPLLRIIAGGKPVVVSAVGSYSEMPSSTCFKISTGDDELADLVNTIKACISNRARLSQVGIAARGYCLTSHTWQQTAIGYLNAINTKHE